MIEYQTVSELIKQRRSQMLIHSYLYYVLDQPIVTDNDWQRWADELVALQHDNPQPIGFYDQEFNDWNASTGMHLPQDDWVRDKAFKLLDSKRKRC